MMMSGGSFLIKLSWNLQKGGLMISEYNVKNMRRMRALAFVVAAVLVGAVIVYFGSIYIESNKNQSDQTGGTSSQITPISIGPKDSSAETANGPSPTSLPVADPTPVPPLSPDELKMSWLTPAVFD